jgi:hypothetical protein
MRYMPANRAFPQPKSASELNFIEHSMLSAKQDDVSFFCRTPYAECVTLAT